MVNFICVPHCDGYSILLDVPRVLWFEPMVDDEWRSGQEFTRAHMNVVDNKGSTVEIDIALPLEDIAELIKVPMNYEQEG